MVIPIGKQAAGFMLAGVSSGVGKTTLTLGLMAAFSQQGLAVQGFKAGPDYIDPGFHSLATGRPSINLDPWMMGERAVLESFQHHAREADLSIIEGVMGFYDGKDVSSDVGSSAALAKLLHVPVVLVLDASGMARSAAAVIKGFQLLDPCAPIQGVIFNRVGGERHYEMLAQVVQEECGVAAYGYLTKNQELQLPEQHLGLVPVLTTTPAWNKWQGKLIEITAKTVDLEELKKFTFDAPPKKTPVKITLPGSLSRVRIALARDEAFHFYYRENLKLLKEAGAELVPFSPLQDKALPEGVQGLYVGGGFPESYIEVLARNRQMIKAIRSALGQGLPTYAECGGYMLLSQEIVTLAGESYPMAGVIPMRTKMGARLAALGYREVEALSDNLLMKKGESARGHEFHYSLMEIDAHEDSRQDPYPWAYCRHSSLEIDAKAEASWKEGYARDGLLAAYTHLHFCSNPHIPHRFVQYCRAGHS